MNMIASSVTATNTRLRKELEVYGYVFRQVDQDGWQVLLDTVPVAVGRVPQGIKGADRVAHALDKAVAEAGRHRRNFCPPDVVAVPQIKAGDKIPNVNGGGMLVTEAPQGSVQARSKDLPASPADPAKAHPAIQKALNFLNLVGAKYHIEHEGGVYANTVLAPPAPPAKEKRQQAANHYKPLLKDLAIPFSTTISVPEEYDWPKYEATFRSFIFTTYGKDSSIVTANRATRVIEVLVA